MEQTKSKLLNESKYEEGEIIPDEVEDKIKEKEKRVIQNKKKRRRRRSKSKSYHRYHHRQEKYNRKNKDHFRTKYSKRRERNNGRCIEKKSDKEKEKEKDKEKEKEPIRRAKRQRSSSMHSINSNSSIKKLKESNNPLNESASPFNQIQDIENNDENKRKERRRRIEEIQKKFQSDAVVADDNGKPLKNQFTEMFVKFVEQERVEEELFNNETTNSNLNILPDSASPATPDMFADSPLEKRNSDHVLKPLELALDSHDDSVGYYAPKINEIINERYQVIGICGKGIFSTVVKVLDITKKVEAALKIIRNIDVMKMSGEKERSILKKLNDEDKNDVSHIIRLNDTFDLKSHICMVFDLYQMNLRDLLKLSKGEGLSLNMVRNFAKQLIVGFILIHKFRIIHADFKPDNVIVNHALTSIRICDFGSAMQEDEIIVTSELVSRFYRAPEIILGCHYDTKIDIWSLGCTLYELYTGDILFPGRTNNEMLKLIMQLRGKFTTKLLKRGQFSDTYFINDGNSFLSKEIDQFTKKDYIKELNVNQLTNKDLLTMLKNRKEVPKEEEKMILHFRDLLEKCLSLDSNKRISALDAFRHPFLGIEPVSVYPFKINNK